MSFLGDAVFVAVYAGMVLGRFPGLAIDRTGIALLGAIVLVAGGVVAPHDAWNAIDASTLMLLLGLMVVSAQFRMSGLYTRVTELVAGAALRPEGLLALLILVAGGLSAVLANDIVCLAMPPLLIEACSRRRLAPLPYLLALACASNVGSAMTLIGNPQNMLIGQRLGLGFSGYLAVAAVPSLLGLCAVWGIIAWQWRGRWEAITEVPPASHAPLDRWQTVKGGLVLAALLVVFLTGAFPRDIAAMAAAGLLLCSRRMASYKMLALTDWHLLVLFAGLFVVNHGFALSGGLEKLMSAFTALGIDLKHPGWLYVVGVVLSNLVSNVPATMLLLPVAEGQAMAGPALALGTTLAGNLLLVGSIANLIVADQAGRMGITMTWREHARTGVPVAVVTLAIAGAWLWAWAALS